LSLAQALERASAKPAGKRPYFLDPEVERVLAITMAAVQELAVARERIDTLERLLEAKGVVTRGEIERFEPTTDQAAERGQWLQEYLARVLRIVQQEGEAIAADQRGDLYSEDVALELNTPDA
jgi:gamma-glutamyl phosphate reductase